MKVDPMPFISAIESAMSEGLNGGQDAQVKPKTTLDVELQRNELREKIVEKTETVNLEHLSARGLCVTKTDTVKVDKELAEFYIFRCRDCGVESLSFQEFEQHCSAQHKKLPMVECFCGKVLIDRWKLLKHKSQHTEGLPFG